MKTGGEWALLSPDGSYHKLCEPNFFVGREAEMDLTLKSRSVDKQHAVITVNTENSLYQLHDLGTLNGTFVNEVRIKKQPVDLRLRDNIRFGYVSCEERILYGPKWISIEEENTVCDVLRCATGEKYLSRRLKVVVASEKSLRDFSFVKLGLPVVVLDKNDKKIVSFLLKAEDTAVNTDLLERQHFDGNDPSVQEEIWENNSSQPGTERKLSIQSAAHHSDEDVPRPGTAEQEVLMYHGLHSPHPHPSQYHHYPPYPYMPMYHHPPAMCHCPSCTGHRPLHSPHSAAPGNFGHYQQAPHASWSHGTAALQARPRLQRPLSVPGEKFEMIVKGSPLYGQPPWWGWGSSDEEIYNYPNTATILDSESHPAQQQALALKRKKPLSKKDAIEMAQRRHSIGTVSVLAESKAQIVTTRTSKMTYDPEQERALRQQEECVVFQKKSALPRPGYSDQLSPVFEHSTTMDWESPGSYKERVSQESSFGPDSSQSTDSSPVDGSEGHLRHSSSYEIPFIPDYEEVPERPVSQKSDRGKVMSQDNVGKNTAEKQDRVARKKPSSKIKKKTVHLDTSGKDSKAASASRKHSSDTSESECEPSSHSSRRSGVVTVAQSPGSRVFGLTEVNLQRVSGGETRETLSPAPALPNWAQQWTNSPNDNSPVQPPVEVVDSSSTAEDSTASSVVSSSSHVTNTMIQGSEPDNKPKVVTSTSSPSLCRPRSTSSRINSPSVSRSQSLSCAAQSSSPKIPTSRVARSKTMSAALRRSYPSAGNDADTGKRSEIPRRRGTVSSTSDDSDVESSDTSQKTQVRDARKKSDDTDKKGVQLVPEKDAKQRPFSAPRPNKTAMLRAHNSREAAKNNGGKNKSPAAAKARTKSGSTSDVSESSPSARVWSPSPKRSTKSTSDDVPETGIKSNSSPVDGSPTQHAVDEIFSSGPARPLPESLQMKRADSVNKTFVLDEGKADTSVSSVEDDGAMQAWAETVANSQPINESKETSEKSLPDSSPSRPEPPKLDLEATSSRGISLRSKLIPFAPFFESPSYTPPSSNQPFEPPSDSPEDSSGGSRSSTAEGRATSPESVAESMPPVFSPSPPLTPGSAVRTLFDFKGGAAVAQSRRQWGVTDKPVEDLMLSSIHAFSVELRLASESVLAKVKSLYEGSEDRELNGSTKPRTNSDSKQESESAIPDWKSSHAEIAGIFRNLRKVELRLRTMEQALSIMCVAAKKEPAQSFQTRKLSMVETSSSGSFQKWREFKIKARRNSWAVEHRNQFPVPPESEEEEDEDTA